MLLRAHHRARLWVLAALGVVLGGLLSLLAVGAASAEPAPAPAGPQDIFAGEWGPVGSRYQAVPTGPNSYEIILSPGPYDIERYLCTDAVKSIHVIRDGNRLEGKRAFHYASTCEFLGDGSISIDLAPDGTSATVTHLGPQNPPNCPCELVEPWARTSYARGPGVAPTLQGRVEWRRDAVTGLFVLTLVSIGLSFIPVVGTGKGVIEAGTGVDLVTRAPLAPWERVLNVVPFGKVTSLGKLGKAAHAAEGLTTAGRAAHAAEEAGALSRTTRYLDELPLGGNTGRRAQDVRLVENEARLREIHQDLIRGGEPTTWGKPGKEYPGPVVKHPDGVGVGLREGSSEFGPTIDLRLPNGDLKKIHIRPENHQP
ncbi:pre-toxin TG domain-containing protein [Micromonospora sp. NPDC050417]|uniref:pre-toxin TG domain-containing protein n=1 Tax=Micromonospora sp. NPDC050417 TaxID=3364280 RepID=UPI003794733C